MYSISVVSLLFAAFLFVKVCGFATISWWIVFSPFIVTFGVWSIIILLTFLYVVFIGVVEHFKTKK